MDDIRRIPPNSLEAEQSVIGAMMLDNDVLDDVFVLITEDDFYHPDIKTVFNAIRKLKQCNSSIDLITVSEGLGENLERIGGIEYLKNIIMNITTSAYVISHCKIIKEKAYARRIIKFGQSLMANGYEQNNEEIMKALSDIPIMGSEQSRKHKNTLDLLQDTVNDIFRRMESDKSDLRGLPTGYPTLDKATGGMKPGEIIGVKAGPNVGKSVFCINVCQQLAQKGIETGFFAYEMVGEQFGYRLATSEMKVPIEALVNPKDSLKSNQKYLRRIQKYQDENINNLHIFPSNELPKRTVQEIEAKLRIYPDIKMIVVDYLQLLKHPTITGMDAYTENLRELKHIASKYYIPVMIILGETRAGEIRGTNEIDHDLDQLYEIKRDKYGEEKSDRESAKIMNKKGRDGKICKADVRYFEDYITFKEIDHNASTERSKEASRT